MHNDTNKTICPTMLYDNECVSSLELQSRPRSPKVLKTVHFVGWNAFHKRLDGIKSVPPKILHKIASHDG